jgi:hypothetical protein
MLELETGHPNTDVRQAMKQHGTEQNRESTSHRFFYFLPPHVVLEKPNPEIQ